MPSYKKLSNKDKKRIKKALELNKLQARTAWRELSAKYGKGSYSLENITRYAKEEMGIVLMKGRPNDAKEESEGLKMTMNDTAGCLTLNSKTARTLQGAMDVAEVDESIWEVERYVVNKWDCVAKVAMRPTSDGGWTQDLGATELWQVKVWLRRKKVPIIATALTLIEDRIKSHAPKYSTRLQKPKGTHMLEISLFDVHFGKLAWERESGENYDLKIAERLYGDAISQLLTMASSAGVEKILMPLGQDFFHINSVDATTPKANNPLDTDGRLAKVFEAGYMAVINAIDRCLPVAPVEVIWVPGNHDPETSLFLCHVLKAWYTNCKDVYVDVEPTFRKYKRYGSCLIGYTHGDEEPHSELPLIMASEMKEDWADTAHREWHIGHTHKRKEVKFLAGDTFNGVSVRTLPSLSAADAWHFKKGYVKSARAAEAYLWDYDFGYAGHFSANVVNGDIAKMDLDRMRE